MLERLALEAEEPLDVLVVAVAETPDVLHLDAQELAPGLGQRDVDGEPLVLLALLGHADQEAVLERALDVLGMALAPADHALDAGDHAAALVLVEDLLPTGHVLERPPGALVLLRVHPQGEVGADPRRVHLQCLPAQPRARNRDLLDEQQARVPDLQLLHKRRHLQQAAVALLGVGHNQQRVISRAVDLEALAVEALKLRVARGGPRGRPELRVLHLGLERRRAPLGVLRVQHLKPGGQPEAQEDDQRSSATGHRCANAVYT
mmetsp:Transcript_86070/g.243714  ORF Transcript_86070/g.243714 Transcript_86070/m.243714 type:complete len:262 (+) Transcript_86070:324-1109(+)